ncbi:MAG: RsmB/NOP family class I SAM-dependent RNA methyltransferase [Cytophagaceae bacterium]|nr:RsmB/NOP family class I SAM-dependent RNA methyltransferase [Cytophagaceae bacterium]
MKKEIRLHRNLCSAVVAALGEIFLEGKYADKAIERILKSDTRWGSRDRGFVAESTYEIVRQYRYWSAVCGLEEPKDSDSFWQLLGAMLSHQGLNPLPQWDEWKHRTWERMDESNPDLSKRAVQYSVPDWLDGLGMQELPDRWELELKSLNQPAEVVLRANTLKISTRDLQKALEKESIFTNSFDTYPDALVLQRRANVFSSKCFKEGWFEVQDASSQLVAPFLEVKPGMRVIDACAGGGGKALHLAALMRNKGQLLAMDVEEWKLKNLKVRARRAGASIIETRLIDSSKTIKRLEASADRLLLDVPCSGLGVLKRNPDAKWKLSPSTIDQVKKTQKEILERYSTMLKPGGLMVYATCSILPGENLKQLEHFLHTHPHFTKLQHQTCWPSETGFDGFFMALVKREL